MPLLSEKDSLRPETNLLHQTGLSEIPHQPWSPNLVIRLLCLLALSGDQVANWGFAGGASGKELVGSIPGLRRSPKEGMTAYSNILA